MSESNCQVIVAGFGLIGRFVTECLEKAAARVTLIEMNPTTVNDQQGLGRSVVAGDVSDRAVLERAGVTTAHALVLTVPDEAAAIRACGVARQLNPEIYIAIRTNHMSGAMIATRSGATHVTIEELVTAQAMSEAVIGGLQIESP